MAAKAALLAVLADSSLTEKDMVSSALTTARQYKLGVLPLRKLLDEMTNSQGKTPVETVEDAVMELVEHACGSSSIEKESSSKAAIADGDSKDHSTVHEPEVRDTHDSDHDHDPVDSASGLPKAKALAMQSVRKPDFGAKSGCCSQQSPCTLSVMAGMMKKTVEWCVLFAKSANKASLQVSGKMILEKQCWICSQSFVSSVFAKQRDCFRSFS